MAKAAIETFRGVIKEAEKIYNKIVEETKSTADNGNIKLVWKYKISDGIENISKCMGILETKMKELNKDSDRKEKYQAWYDRLKELREDLKQR